MTRPVFHAHATTWILFRRTQIMGAVIVALGVASLAHGDLKVLPSEIELCGRSAQQRILLVEVEGETTVADRSSSADWKSSNDSVARFEGGKIIATGEGTAEIVATIDGQSVRTTVQVHNFLQPESWEFRRHILPVISKAGCNNGACHGALAGKGGFKLSLRGYDPAGDHYAITREARGRRIELADPGRSLVLAKPTGALPHKGGLRLDVNSGDYQRLASWIAQGAVGPGDEDPRVEQIHVFPRVASLTIGDQQQLVVQARYSDARVEDVTHWAKFTSANETVAQVDDSGGIEIVGRGEGAIVVWFSSRLELAKIVVPFANQLDANVVANMPVHNFIDERVNQKLIALNLEPSPRCDDATFIRRAFLDTIGKLPTSDEVLEFLANEANDKRSVLIDALLARKEFVDYWSYRWSDVLLVNGKRLRPEAVKAYYQWIRERVESNTPWDEVVRDILTAQGSSYENGATNFYALHQSPEEMAENASQAFLGLSIGCAKCHNHPLEKWTNDQYYAMANLFARVRSKGWGGDARNGDGLRTLFLAETGDLTQPLTGRPQPPTPLDGEPLAFDDPGDRRGHLAVWLTSPENPYFSRATVNRVWANFMGRGLVEAVDDMRTSNPATNEPLLADLANYLTEHNFDLKSLMRVILRSAAYQRSSVAIPANEADDRFYARYYPRRMMAEVLLDAISDVTEVPTEFNQITYNGADVRETKEYPLGTRALQLYDSAVKSKFLSTFGRNQRDIVCECERTNKPSMVQVLHISNGTTINDKLKAENSCVAQLLAGDVIPDEIVSKAYLKTLSRHPSDGEMTQIKEIFADVGEAGRREVIEDLYWSLMSCREFLFHH